MAKLTARVATLTQEKTSLTAQLEARTGALESVQAEAALLRSDLAAARARESDRPTVSAAVSAAVDLARREWEVRLAAAQGVNEALRREYETKLEALRADFVAATSTSSSGGSSGTQHFAGTAAPSTWQFAASALAPPQAPLAQPTAGAQGLANAALERQMRQLQEELAAARADLRSAAAECEALRGRCAAAEEGVTAKCAAAVAAEAARAHAREQAVRVWGHSIVTAMTAVTTVTTVTDVGRACKT